jgi:hypothetical protein
METNEEVISRLKFIGHIDKDEKINVKHVNKQPNTVFTKISRSLIYPDNRMNSLKFVKDVILRSFDIVENSLHNNAFLLCKSIVLDLTKAKQGILNLRYTYNEDTKYCCDIDVLIEQISTKLATLKQNHPMIFECTIEQKS